MKVFLNNRSVQTLNASILAATNNYHEELCKLLEVCSLWQHSYYSIVEKYILGCFTMKTNTVLHGFVTRFN